MHRKVVISQYDIPDLQALLGPSVSRIEIREVDFGLTEISSKHDRVPRIFLAQSATHYRFDMNPSLSDSNSLSIDRL